MTGRDRERASDGASAFVHQHQPDAESYLWTIAVDGNARIAHGRDARSYLVQRRGRSGWWKMVEDCPSRRALLFVVIPSGAEGDGGPVVRSDLLRAVAERLPASPVDFDGSGMPEQLADALAAVGFALPGFAAKPRQAKAKAPAARDPARTRAGRAANGSDRRKTEKAAPAGKPDRRKNPRKRALIPGKVREGAADPQKIAQDGQVRRAKG